MKNNDIISNMIPSDDKLEIRYLSKVFDLNRVSNSYKFFWFKAIVNNVSPERTVFSYDELINEMIVDAYYMVNEYHLRLGPVNTVDNLEESAKYLYRVYGKPSTIDRTKLLLFVSDLADNQFKKYKDKLKDNVPYCFQSPFYADLKNPSHSKIDQINLNKLLIYSFEVGKSLQTKIRIKDDWADYLYHNVAILNGWIECHLIDWLQKRNPSVPGISNKLSCPKKRELKRVGDYWKTVISVDGRIREIYRQINMSDEKVSIDHFVPWQYVAHDELWNLSPTTININSEKGNLLPNWDKYFLELGEIQYRAYELVYSNRIIEKVFYKCADYHLNNADIRHALFDKGLQHSQVNGHTF